MILFLLTTAQATCIDPEGRAVDLRPRALRLGDRVLPLNAHGDADRVGDWLGRAYGDETRDLFLVWHQGHAWVGAGELPEPAAFALLPEAVGE